MKEKHEMNFFFMNPTFIESIFIGSEDIRHQLPAESELFDKTNKKFQSQMKILGQNPNVIFATKTEGLAENLELIQGEMAQCEKVLTDYLETKRLLFPRFYFLSSMDLLDILSNGNEPLLVAKHLIKLFDSLAKISLAGGAGTESDQGRSNVATKMIAKDGEIVNLKQPFACDGQVEKWLDQLMSSMRETLKSELKASIQEYDVTPREQWLFNYPAQISLTGAQIFWSVEVGRVFDMLSGGYENAMKDYYKQQISRLNKLIPLLLGSLSKGSVQRKKKNFYLTNMVQYGPNSLSFLP